MHADSTNSAYVFRGTTPQGYSVRDRTQTYYGLNNDTGNSMGMGYNKDMNTQQRFCPPTNTDSKESFCNQFINYQNQQIMYNRFDTPERHDTGQKEMNINSGSFLPHGEEVVCKKLKGHVENSLTENACVRSSTKSERIPERNAKFFITNNLKATIRFIPEKKTEPIYQSQETILQNEFGDAGLITGTESEHNMAKDEPTHQVCRTNNSKESFDSSNEQECDFINDISAIVESQPDNTSKQAKESPELGPEGTEGIAELGPEDTEGIAELGPEDTEGIAELGPEDTEGIAELGPEDTEGIAELGPEDTEGIAELGPEDTEGIAKLGLEDTEGIANLGPEDTEGKAKLGPGDSEGISKLGPGDTEGIAKLGPGDTEGIAKLAFPSVSSGPSTDTTGSSKKKQRKRKKISDNSINNSSDPSEKKVDSKEVEEGERIHKWVEQTCQVCEKSYKRKEHLLRHMQTSHSELRPFVCKVCAHTFSRKDRLLRHEKIHSGVPEYKCNACEKCFVRRDSLTKHLLVHINVKDTVSPSKRARSNKGAQD